MQDTGKIIWFLEAQKAHSVVQSTRTEFVYKMF